MSPRKGSGFPMVPRGGFPAVTLRLMKYFGFCTPCFSTAGVYHVRRGRPWLLPQIWMDQFYPDEVEVLRMRRRYIDISLRNAIIQAGPNVPVGRFERMVLPRIAYYHYYGWRRPTKTWKKQVDDFCKVLKCLSREECMQLYIKIFDEYLPETPLQPSWQRNPSLQEQFRIRQVF